MYKYFNNALKKFNLYAPKHSNKNNFYKCDMPNFYEAALWKSFTKSYFGTSSPIDLYIL